MLSRRRPVLAVPTVHLAVALLVGLPIGARACELVDQLLVGCSPPPVPPPADQPPPPLPPLEDLPGVILLPTDPGRPGPPPPPVRPPTGKPVLLPEAALHLLDLANAERAAVGSQPLTSRPDVAEVAATHSLAMAERGSIWHNAAYVTDVMADLLQATSVRGENVAWSSDLGHAHRLLTQSAAHRMNMLDPRYSVAGFAVARSSDGNYWVTQNFLQPVAAPAPLPTPRAPSAPAPAVAGAAAEPAPQRPPGSPAAPGPSTTAVPGSQRPASPSGVSARPPVQIPGRFAGAVLVGDQPAGDATPPRIAALAAALAGTVAVGDGLAWWSRRYSPS